MVNAGDTDPVVGPRCFQRLTFVLGAGDEVGCAGEEGVSYQSALAEAQALGLAEADPSADVGGGDAASKAAILASLAFGLSAVALAGYFTQLETAYGWGNLTRMAVHTSVGFMGVGAGVLAFLWGRELSPESRVPDWLPVLPIMKPVLPPSVGT